MSEVLSTSSATVTTTDYLMFTPVEDSTYRYDDIRLVSDDLSTTTTFAYDDANELTSMTNNGTINFAYDDWGRTISKWQGDFDATYAYRYGDKLYSITSDFNGEGNVTYQYGADGKRRQRTANSVTTKYRWDAGWSMINEENVLDALTMTYITAGGDILAELTGTVPSSGTARYYCHDHLGSTRRLRAADKSSSGQYEFTPYGSPYSESGIALSALGGAFTGKPWDAVAQLYHFPFRQYAPTIAHWLARDPAGTFDGAGLYAYVDAEPIGFYDPSGGTKVPSPPKGDQHYKDGSCLNFDGLNKDSMPSDKVVKGLKCISKKLGGICLRVTGGTSPKTGSAHTKNSQHNTGNAADIRTRGLPDDAKGNKFWCAAKECKFTFGLDEGNHYHVDFGPDRGKPKNPKSKLTNMIRTCKCESKK